MNRFDLNLKSSRRIELVPNCLASVMINGLTASDDILFAFYGNIHPFSDTCNVCQLLTGFYVVQERSKRELPFLDNHPVSINSTDCDPFTHFTLSQTWIELRKTVG